MKFSNDLPKGFELKKPCNYVHENYFQVGASSNSITKIGLYTTGISPVHSTITYKDHLRPYFIFMLCLNRIQTQRHQKRSLISKLPKEIHSLIVSYLGETKSYYIRDEGSNEGTYQIIRPDKPIFLKSGQMFRITKDLSINIFEVQNKGSLKLSRNNVNIIKKLIKHDQVELLGLDSSQSRLIQDQFEVI